MDFSELAASLLGNMLAGKREISGQGVVRANKGIISLLKEQ